MVFVRREILYVLELNHGESHTLLEGTRLNHALQSQFALSDL